jgi:hypothetical protein
METSTITRIDKYDVASQTFSKEDVLFDPSDREERWRQLNHGMTLGNLHKVAARISFKDANDQAFETEATIWAVTENNVILKNNIMIPIRSIFKVNT